MSYSVGKFAEASARRRKLAIARERYQPGISTPSVPHGLQAIWDDMTRNGVPERGGPPPTRVNGDELHALRHEPYLGVVIETVRDALAGDVSGLIAVVDPRCYVLLAHGTDDDRARAERVGLSEGVVWNCLTGANGIGLCAMRKKPIQFLAESHWCRDQFELVCSVVPVVHSGRLVAMINITDEWSTANRDTLKLLELLAEKVEHRLAEVDRDHQALRCAAKKLLTRCGSPALVMHNRNVIAARGMPYLPGDRIDFSSAVTPGVHLLRFGHVLVEPLPHADHWLVREASPGDLPRMRVIFDFAGPRNRVVRVRETIVEWDQPVSRPQHAAILTSLYQHRSGVTAAELSSELYGEPTRLDNVRPLISQLRKELWWLLKPSSYRLGEQLTIEMRSEGS